MTSFRTLDELDPKGKRILLRLDLNVPMEDGKVTDATRIERVLPTIRELAGEGRARWCFSLISAARKASPTRRKA